MPFSDFPPPIVYPDTDKGRSAVRREVHPELWRDVGYCDRWRADQFSTRCSNADPGGERSYSWCHRCPAGWMFSRLTARDLERTRDFTSITGH